MSARAPLLPLSALYRALSRARLGSYRAHLLPVRRLGRPVISVGNLTTGGAGKTPLVRHLAARLLAAGERPAILSRGYARRGAPGDLLIVSDGRRLRADVYAAGDEPFMLARSLPAAIVIACASRWRAGRVAEGLGATMHLLDDGFQHVKIARDVDLLVMDGRELGHHAHVLPAGPLREPLSAIERADAILAPETVLHELAARVGEAGPARFALAREDLAPVPLEPEMDPPLPYGSQVLAVAAIARPEAFFDRLRLWGYRVLAARAFRDHYWFAASDVRTLVSAARAVRAAAIITTEKDAVRLMPLRPIGMPVYYVPVEARPADTAEFERWLGAKIVKARSPGGASL